MTATNVAHSDLAAAGAAAQPQQPLRKLSAIPQQFTDISDLLRKVRRKLLPVAPESKRSEAAWDAEYTSDYWEYLQSDAELPRYALIAALIRQFPAAALLDLGCGEGILLDHLYPGSFSRYVGVDFSQEAIARANTCRAGDQVQFECADAETYAPQQAAFDVLVFNEVLYYFADTTAVVQRLSKYMKPGGVIIASIYTPALRQLRRHLKQISAAAAATEHFVVAHQGTACSWAVIVWRTAVDSQLAKSTEGELTMEPALVS